MKSCIDTVACPRCLRPKGAPCRSTGLAWLVDLVLFRRQGELHRERIEFYDFVRWAS